SPMAYTRSTRKWSTWARSARCSPFSATGAAPRRESARRASTEVGPAIAPLRPITVRWRPHIHVQEQAMSREVVIVSGVRTAVGTFGGSLKDHTPTQLGAMVVRESAARAGL